MNPNAHMTGSPSAPLRLRGKLGSSPSFDVRRSMFDVRRFPLPFLLLASVLWPLASVCRADLFAGSDTYVVTNAAGGAIVVTNAPMSGGAPLAWHAAGILVNFRDEPTGAVLRVSHVRQGIVNPHVNTNAGGTIAVTNLLYRSGTGATDALVWDPTNRYTIVPTNDALRIETSSTNAEIILNKAVQR